MMAPLPFPSAEQVIADGLATHAGLDVVGEPCTIKAGGIDYGPLPVFVRTYRREELVPGGPIEQGDFRAMIYWPSFEALGIGRRLERADRLVWRERLYSILQFDDATHSAAGQIFAVELQLRG
jgi:hypothetical protein